MVIYYLEADNITLFSFYNSITYLKAIMHKNVVSFKIDIVIYTEVDM